MPKSFLTSFVLLVLIVLLSPAGISAAVDPLSSIEQDYRDGRLTLDERVLLQIAAIKNPAALPDRYRPETVAASATYFSKCATPVLLDIRSNWDLLNSSTQATYTAAFLRAVTESVYVSPSGFFKLHYDTTGANAVPIDDLDASGVPDFVERCAAYLDSSLATHQALGYRLPPGDSLLGGDTLLDVYFEELGGIYGYAQPEGPGPEPWNDSYSYLVLHRDFLDFPANYDPEGSQAGAAKATCAHEFHHCVQFAYDAGDDIWFMEMDATHIEDIVFEQVDDNYNYLPGFFTVPEKSLMETGNHAYSSFIWGIFLGERFDTSLMEAIWDGARFQTAFAAMTDTIAGRYGVSRDAAFTEFAIWNYLTQGRDDGVHYSEDYPFSVKTAKTHTLFPVTLQTAPYNPAGYGAAYVQFFPGGRLGTLEITVNGDDAREWGAYLVLSSADNVHTFEPLALSPGAYYGIDSVLHIENFYRVTLVMVNTMEYSAGAFFNYSATIIPPYAVRSSVVTVDSAVYSGGRRDFEYRITNDAPVVDVLDVTAWDNSGWVSPGTQSFSLAAESDSIVTIQVAPPNATPLGSVSEMWFKVASRGNPAMVDSQVVGARTTLQRGDLDFEGEIKISDLTYLVNFLFKSGAPPVPMADAGDFSCDAFVNVTDLTQLVKYLFQGGNSPICNPY